MLKTLMSEFAQTNHILLVEDYPANILVAETLLEGLNYTFDTVSDGQAAFDAATSGKYQAVLMDVEMPVYNGYRATELIRQYEIKKNLPRVAIIGMTAHASESDHQKCLSAGMDDYISKPFALDNLHAKLIKWTSKQNSAAA